MLNTDACFQRSELSKDSDQKSKFKEKNRIMNTITMVPAAESEATIPL